MFCDSLVNYFYISDISYELLKTYLNFNWPQYIITTSLLALLTYILNLVFTYLQRRVEFMLKLKIVDNCAGRSLRPSGRGLEFSLGHCRALNLAASIQPLSLVLFLLQNLVFQCIRHISCPIYTSTDSQETANHKVPVLKKMVTWLTIWF